MVSICLDFPPGMENCHLRAHWMRFYVIVAQIPANVYSWFQSRLVTGHTPPPHPNPNPLSICVCVLLPLYRFIHISKLLDSPILKRLLQNCKNTEAWSCHYSSQYAYHIHNMGGVHQNVTHSKGTLNISSYKLEPPQIRGQVYCSIGWEDIIFPVSGRRWWTVCRYCNIK